MTSDVYGLCQHCGKPGAMYTCMLCGSYVCKDCVDHGTGICCKCAPSRSNKEKHLYR